MMAPRNDESSARPMAACSAEWSSSRLSCGLQQAKGEGVHFIRHALGLDFSVDNNAAADAVTITLSHDASDNRRLRGLELHRPRQARFFDKLGVGIDVEIVDVGNG